MIRLELNQDNIVYYIGISALLVMALFLSFPLEPFTKKPLTDYPAVVTFYDPSKGDINCDDDCTTVATGILTNDMYFTSGACHEDLLGRTVYFPAIDFEMECVDTGGMITVLYSKYYKQDVLYFDVMWDADNPPEWNYWLLEKWSVK